MTARRRFLALDLGAESGRGMVGSFDGDRLELAEVHRFPNTPVTLGGTLHWDFLRLYGDVLAAIERATATGPLASIGTDTWGVDFGLLDASGRLLANPVHYRDRRTEGILPRLFARLAPAELYRRTGIQFMPINTLCQLLAMREAGDPLLDQADQLLLMPDLINHFLCGRSVAEYTIASTSQCLDAQRRTWDRDLVERIGVRAALLPEIVPPGTVLGPLLPGTIDGTPAGQLTVVATASHDTAAAVAGAPLADDRTAFLSSGTWSLVGREVPAPILSEAALGANLTNEGGVAGTIRLLRNVMGLWLVQESRRCLWPGGSPPSYEEIAAQAEGAHAFTAFIDPDDERFLRPGDLPALVRAYCAETGQPTPDDPGTLFRVLFESLALRYAVIVDELAAVTGRPIETIQVVGGGSRNTFLSRLTAAATGRVVRAGPAEATAIGNLAVQAIAVGELADLAEARDLVARSFPVSTVEPAGEWATARERYERLMAGRARTGGREAA